jgi:hypothetical protein
VGKTKEKRPLRTKSRIWEDNIKMRVKATWRRSCIQCNLGQDKDKWKALVKKAMKISVPQNAGNSLISGETVSFSRTPLRDAY